eukprot:600150-Rhodomonas_salina.1
MIAETQTSSESRSDNQTSVINDSSCLANDIQVERKKGRTRKHSESESSRNLKALVRVADTTIQNALAVVQRRPDSLDIT